MKTEYEVTTLKNGKVTTKIFEHFHEALSYFKDEKWLHHHYANPSKGLLIKWFGGVPCQTLREFGY